MDNSFFYPVQDVITDTDGRGLIVGTNGSLTYVVQLFSPEVYSLYKDELSVRHEIFIQALSRMPDNSYVHKQDVYRLKNYEKVTTPALSYLDKADKDHFSGREYMTHTCVLAFTLSGLHSLSEAYVKNPLAFDEKLNQEDITKLKDFLTSVEYAINNLSSLRNTHIAFSSTEEVKKYLFLSANFYESTGVQDIHFSKDITSGSYSARMYAISDSEFLPEGEFPVSSKDYTVSKDKSELYCSPAESFAGIHLFCNHVYNQIFYFFSDRRLKEQLKKNLDDHISNRGWDKVNIPSQIAKLQSLATDIKENRELLCYAHYSIMLWDKDIERLNSAEKQMRSVLNVQNINYYIPFQANLATVYAGSIIGCTSSLPVQYMFVTSLSLAVAMLVHYTTFVDDEEGVMFNDRLYQIPHRKDIWDAKGLRIKARNAIVVAPTGGGKSFFTNNIVQQLLDQNYTVVTVEFGNSFKQLCYLYPEISTHVEYDQGQPLGINPFNMDGQPMTSDKEEFLVSLCLRFWRSASVDVNQTVTLRKFIQEYYKDVENGHSFQGFYLFIKDNFDVLAEQCNIKKEFFDIDSFLHVCSEFMPGGTYENICASSGVASNLSSKRFIHFELTKVKSDPFVASIVMSLLFDIINNKILSDSSKKGYIIFDEYAETAQMKSLNPLDVNIHQTVTLYYQKIRKENGSVMTIIQSPVQLPDNEFTKGIIANTQLLYVLEGTEVVYNAVIDTFKITSAAQINQMKSIQNNYACTRPYSECWIRWGDNYSETVRLEASKRKFYAFQTQGELRARLDALYAGNGHNMQKAIEDIINQQKS